ncbi:hypothetical protein [Salinarimonas soli]|uniref:Uncharacterized protein n=1 Tax=Salinarimonas soli TaxID=1638099 RepID=A0A5B2VG92_9HYPH|nr:hypothetical protein [Salinarimonas soli]KAA2237648.1 hypothetical protein F0L46_08180 [Salinarimonas soli]
MSSSDPFEKFRQALDAAPQHTEPTDDELRQRAVDTFSSFWEAIGKYDALVKQKYEQASVTFDITRVERRDQIIYGEIRITRPSGNTGQQSSRRFPFSIQGKRIWMDDSEFKKISRVRAKSDIAVYSHEDESLVADLGTVILGVLRS